MNYYTFCTLCPFLLKLTHIWLTVDSSLSQTVSPRITHSTKHFMNTKCNISVILIIGREISATFKCFVKIVSNCYFSAGVRLPFYKECITAAPGDGLIHILLPCWLQSGKTVWLQATNGKWSSFCCIISWSFAHQGPADFFVLFLSLSSWQPFRFDA